MDEVAVETFHCVNHPHVETLVRCSRCEAPICPRCMISTPVGMRCRACANLRRAPIYDLRGRYLWQAVGAAFGLLLAGSFIFNLVLGVVGRSILFAAIVYALAGIGIAELISTAANRKRGPVLQALAIVTTVLVTQSGFLLALVVTARLNLNVITLALTALASILAWQRLR